MNDGGDSGYKDIASRADRGAVASSNQGPNTKSRDWTVIAMTIMCLSLSYRSVPAEVLEKLAVPTRELGEVLARLHTVPENRQVVVLSTCNRWRSTRRCPGQPDG